VGLTILGNNFMPTVTVRPATQVHAVAVAKPELRLPGKYKTEAAKQAAFTKWRRKIMKLPNRELNELLKANNPELQLTDSVYLEFHSCLEKSEIFIPHTSDALHGITGNHAYFRVDFLGDAGDWLWQHNICYRVHESAAVARWPNGGGSSRWCIRAAVVEFKSDADLCMFMLAKPFDTDAE
jgi:hypothetical protein